MYDFTGQGVLITGGTDGIGLAAAARFAAAGAAVLVTGRDAERGARALATLPAGVHFLQADAGRLEDAKRMVDECLARMGRLDIAVNNAAAEFPLVPTAEIPVESVQETLDVNLRGAWACMKHEIDAMLAQGGGNIVNVSSVNGYLSSVNAAMYSASKHGMNGLTTAAAKEYMRHGIRINSVCPGAIETPRRQRRLTGFDAGQVEAHYADLAKKIPLARAGTADEVAAAIVWLASPESSYVVGHHLVVDGGLSA